MSNRKQEIKLIWPGKDKKLKLDPKVLVEDPSKSYGDKSSDNMLIHGDNLPVLKILERDFSDRIKCIFIDPPYNIGNTFKHYDDCIEHPAWLSFMKPRLIALKNLLAKDGVIFIAVNDKEGHYVKVLCDEIFGRKNFIQTICWRSRNYISINLLISPNHNFIFLYAKDQPALFNNLKSFRLKEDSDGFKNPDNDPNGPWKLSPLNDLDGERKSNPFYEFQGISNYWKYPMEIMQELYKKGEIIKKEKNLFRKYYLSNGGKAINTWWDDCGTTPEAKEESIKLFKNDFFDTPKPERLLERVINLGSQPGDWVLDCFLGSGTTSAVAHKMNRKHIGIEFGNHINTHCLSRLKKVVDGNDGLKLSEKLSWKGGGGFKFYDLANAK